MKFICNRANICDYKGCPHRVPHEKTHGCDKIIYCEAIKENVICILYEKIIDDIIGDL